MNATAHGPIFVFASNLQGIHGKGSALEARKNYGAELGVGIGPTGRAFAIPTRERLPNGVFINLPLTRIQVYVDRFKRYASGHQELKFLVVKIGCGEAGYKEEQIKPMFAWAAQNVKLPDGWRQSIA